MQMYIQALELELTPDEMKSKIPATLLPKIQGKGILQAYTVAHEGKSQPKVLGEGVKPIHWTKAVIRRLADSIKQGSKFFVGHGATNSHDGRSEVGEVLTSFVKEIKGRLSNIVIGWFPDESKVKSMDVCSIEADIDVDASDFVNDVNEVSAIALGASAIDSPAFPGAVRLASLQCFEEDTNKGKTKPGEGEKMAVTFSEVKDFVKEHNVFPHQLFAEQDLRNDRQFGNVFVEAEASKKEVGTLKAKLEEQDKAIKKLEIETKSSGAKERFEALLAKDMTKKQKDFMLSRFNATEIAVMSDDDLKKYIENERKVFADTAKLFGVTENEQSGKGEDSSNADDAEEGDSTPEDEALKLIGAR